MEQDPQTMTHRHVNFPGKMVEEVQKAIKEKHCSFSAFINEAVQKALADLAEEE